MSIIEVIIAIFVVGLLIKAFSNIRNANQEINDELYPFSSENLNKKG